MPNESIAGVALAGKWRVREVPAQRSGFRRTVGRQQLGAESGRTEGPPGSKADCNWLCRRQKFASFSASSEAVSVLGRH